MQELFPSLPGDLFSTQSVCPTLHYGPFTKVDPARVDSTLVGLQLPQTQSSCGCLSEVALHAIRTTRYLIKPNCFCTGSHHFSHGGSLWEILALLHTLTWRYEGSSLPPVSRAVKPRSDGTKLPVTHLRHPNSFKVCCNPYRKWH